MAGEVVDPPGRVADPPRRAALGEGSPSTDPSAPASDPGPFTPSLRPSVTASLLLPADLTLLTHFFTGKHEPLTLALSVGMSLADLLIWQARPEIQKAFADYQSLQDKAIAPIETAARQTLIIELQDLIKITDDLIEKRRAATTLLRALNPPRRPAKNVHSTGTPPNPSPSRSSCTSCSTSSRSESKSAKSAAVDDLLSLLDQDGTLNRTRLTDIADQIDLENQQALDTESDEDNEDDEDDDDSESDDDEESDDPQGSRSPRRPVLTSSRPSSSPSPAHLPTSPPAHSQAPPDPSLHPQHAELEGPDPSYTPDQVVDRLMKVLHTRMEIDIGPLGIVRNFLSKESPLFRPTFREIAQQLMDFSIIDLQASRTWEYLESTLDANTATRQVQTTDRTCGPKRVFLFTLTRAGPEEPWLLHDIKFHSGAPIKILPNPYRSNNTS